MSSAEGLQVRAFDTTTVNGPGKTGSQWRLHYSVSLPSLAYVSFKLTATEAGHGRVVPATVPGAEFPATAVLEYRLRWQVELVFERFKSLAQLGHLPKHNYDSAKRGFTASSW